MYALTISFTPEQLNMLYATNSKIIISKTNDDGNSVAWQVLRPLEFYTITWEENYGIYVSDLAIDDKTELIKISSIPIPAIRNQSYTFIPAGYIVGPENENTTYTDSFLLLNDFNNDANYIVAGLFQDAFINGREIKGNAVSAYPLLRNSTKVMTPINTINLWIASQIQRNTIVKQINAPVTTFTYGTDVLAIKVYYDSNTGLFVQA